MFGFSEIIFLLADSGALPTIKVWVSVKYWCMEGVWAVRETTQKKAP